MGRIEIAPLGISVSSIILANSRTDNGVDLAEEHESDAEQQEPDHDDQPGTKPVDKPALQGAQYSTFGASHGKRAGDDGLAPLELLTQQNEVDAETVEEQDSVKELEDESGGDDPPPIEHLSRCPFFLGR